MPRADTVLILLLRVMGVSALFALLAVVMPFSWMAAIHRGLGLGEMPAAPIVDYLARSLSAFYALLGTLCLAMAADLERYQPLVRVLALAYILMGAIFTGVDVAAGMTAWWTACEGPPLMAVAAWMYYLARPKALGKERL